MNKILPNYPSHVWNSFLEQSIGFDKLLRNIEHSHSAIVNNHGYPPYNIIKNGDASYKILLALAGFKAADIHVSLSDNILTIKGADGSQDVENYIVKGIASRKFEKTFSLNEYAVVENVSLKNGILDITINIVLPEEKQPQIFKVEE